MFPNNRLKIDSNIYVWIFKAKGVPKFAFVYYAGHPVTRHDSEVISSDYIGTIRTQMRKQFGIIPILFMQGCGADIRPNITSKRKSYLPKLWLNNRFKAPPSQEDQSFIDHACRNAIQNLSLEDEFVFDEKKIKLLQKSLKLKGEKPITYPVVSLSAELNFHFLPFELSHLFHLNIQKKVKGCFLVSCSQNTYGYLPHPQQLKYGGYEVDSSRVYMGLKSRQELLESEFLI